jgi:hypothetical protein
MTVPLYSVACFAVMSGASPSVAVGSCVLPDSTATTFIVATSANRGSKRSAGIVLAVTTQGGSTNTVEYATVGTVSADISGLAVGTASWVRVSTAGVLERCTPSGADDVVGWCETDGSCHLLFGLFTAAIVAGSGSGALPGGSTNDVQVNAGGGLFGGVSPGTSGNVLASLGTTWASVAPSIALGSQATGTLPLANGGFGADIHASTGIPKVSGGTLTFVAAPAGTIVGTTDTQTLSGKTIAGASNTLTVRLGSDVTGSLPATGGGMGADVSASTGIIKMTTGTASFLTAPSGTLVGTSDTQTLTNKTIAAGSNTISGLADTNVASNAAIAYSKLGGTGTESLGPQEFDSTINAKGTERGVLPKNVQTTDATVTTLDSFTLASNTAVTWTAMVSAIKSDKSQAAGFSISAVFRNNAGTISQVGTTTSTQLAADDASWAATMDFSGTTVRLRITGKAATTIQWSAISTRLEVIP